ncbi:NADPH:quinone reductase-like Zn-dependent oxidoreductase [Microbacterium marinum]|uniref:NADPH:quinone reductase-like Zn-dependent oxidoreductase n=1 Tax=Microbacterium marinum TaxID=421115 RepID=A0A7W7FIT9_9MICO|nr:NADP-dependent oxidoreductase [Microbacterium marinum]MBB4666695.1 NADPH:quinone reductase-like Zn-dependent oxidoreductase [Microbacterium marinum]
MASAITYLALGGPEVLTFGDIDIAAPGPGDVAVRIEAAGVNPLDAKLRAGTRPSPPITSPRRIGFDGAGVVTALGADVDGLRVGDAVAIAGATGLYATDVVVAASTLTPRPPQVSAAQAAALGIPAGTAYQTLRSMAVGPSDVVLVHAGSGAVGQFLIQFAVLWGATVIATTSERRAERVRALGATPVAYGEGLADRVRAAAPQGVTVAIDAAGTDEALRTSIELVDDRGRIVTLVRGADAAGLGIRAFSGGSPEPLTSQQLALRAEAVPVSLQLIAAGALDVELGPTFALADAADAHRALAAGVEGKIVLVP